VRRLSSPSERRQTSTRAGRKREERRGGRERRGEKEGKKEIRPKKEGKNTPIPSTNKRIILSSISIYSA
jgi:hypothetical protein